METVAWQEGMLPSHGSVLLLQPHNWIHPFTTYLTKHNIESLMCLFNSVLKRIPESEIQRLQTIQKDYN